MINKSKFLRNKSSVEEGWKVKVDGVNLHKNIDVGRGQKSCQIEKHLSVLKQF